MGDEWISIGEAASHLGVSEDTARRRADDGELGPLRWTKPPGKGQRRVTLSGVETYLKRMQDEQKPS